MHLLGKDASIMFGEFFLYRTHFKVYEIEDGGDEG